MNSPPNKPQGRKDKARNGGENVDIEVLRKEYRNMQANRNAFAQESDLVQRKQQATLDKVRAENEDLKSNVARLQARHMARPMNPFEQSQLENLYQELDRYTNLSESGKAKSAAMEQEIASLREENWKRRRQIGGVNAAVNDQRQVEKQVRLLESRLDQALVKFNKCVSRNKRLREEIDGLRGERVAFEKVYNKIEKEVRDKKKQMALVIEQSNHSHEQRDRAQLEIAAIEQANRKEEDAYLEQIDKLSVELMKADEELLNKTKQNQMPVMVDPAEEERKAEERKEAARANEIARVEEEYAQQRKERIENYEEASRKISAATGISDVDELVEMYNANEEYIFSLYQYQNEQSAEIERLDDGIHALQEEEATYEAEAGEVWNQHKDELANFENKMRLTEEQTANFEKKRKRNLILIEEMKDEIKFLLIRLDCKLEKQEGDFSVTTDNVIRCLGVVEERSDEIISNHLRVKEISGNDNCDSPHPDGPSGSKPLLFSPPRILDYSSDESGDEGDCNDSSIVKPLHGSDIDYSKVSRSSMKGNTARRKSNGRRQSIRRSM